MTKTDRFMLFHHFFLFLIESSRIGGLERGEEKRGRDSRGDAGSAEGEEVLSFKKRQSEGSRVQSGVKNRKGAATKVGADHRDAQRFRRVERRRGRLCRLSGSFQRNNPTGFFTRLA